MSIMLHDKISGVFLFNTTAGDRCIRLHEGTTMRRLYRIKLPWLPHMADFDQGLFDFGPEVSRLTAYEQRTQEGGNTSDGAIRSYGFLPDLELGICAVVNDSTIYGFCLVTGTLLFRCLGHQTPVTSILTIFTHGYFVSGGEDGAMRVWDLNASILPLIHGKWVRIRGVSQGTRLTDQESQMQLCNSLRSKMLHYLHDLGVNKQWKLGVITSICGSRTKRNNAFMLEVRCHDDDIQLVTDPDLVALASQINTMPDGPGGTGTSIGSSDLEKGAEIGIWCLQDRDDLARSVMESYDELGQGELSLSGFVSALSDLFSRNLNAPEDDQLNDDDILELTRLFDVTGHDRIVYNLFVGFLMKGPKMGIIPSLVWSGTETECVNMSSVAVMLEHTSSITSLAYLPDAELIASASYDGTLRLWDPLSQPQRLTLPIPQYHGQKVLNELAGGRPFQCVKEIQVNEGLRCEAIKGSSANRDDKIVAVDLVPMRLSFLEGAGCDIIVPPESITAAKSVDQSCARESSYKPVSVRGFIYLMQDGTLFSVEGDAFDANCVELKDDSFANKSVAARTVWKERGRVLRVLYVVSNTFDSLERIKECMVNNDLAARHRSSIDKLDAQFVVFYCQGDGPERDLSHNLVNSKDRSSSAEKVLATPAVFLHQTDDGKICFLYDHDQRVHTVPASRVDTNPNVPATAFLVKDTTGWEPGQRIFIRQERPSYAIVEEESEMERNERAIHPREVLCGSVVAGNAVYTVCWMVGRFSVGVEARQYEDPIAPMLEQAVLKQGLDTWATNLHRYRAECCTIRGKAIRDLRADDAIIENESSSTQKSLLQPRVPPRILRLLRRGSVVS